MATVYRSPLFHYTGLSNTGGYYLPLGTGSSSNTSVSATQARVKMKHDGTIANLRVICTANAASASRTVTVYKNGSATSLTLTVPAGTTGIFEDTTNTVTYTAGDDISIFVSTGGTGNFTLRMVGADILTTQGMAKLIGGGELQTLSSASVTRYSRCVGSFVVSDTADTFSKNYYPVDGTLKKPSIYVESNTRSTATTFTLQVNGSDTGVVITVPALSTGYFDDDTNTASIAAGDYTCWKMVSGSGAGSTVLGMINIEFEPTTAGNVIVSGSTKATNMSTGQTRRVPCLSGLGILLTTESWGQQLLRGTGTISKYYTEIVTNTATFSTTCTMRKNGSNQGVTMSISAGSTGLFSDTSNSFTYADGDNVTSEYVAASGGSGSFQSGNHAFLIQPTAETIGGAAGNPWYHYAQQ